MDGWKDGWIGSSTGPKDWRRVGGGEDSVYVRKLEKCEDADNRENTRDQAFWWTCFHFS